jgi:CBS domain-containing protein
VNSLILLIVCILEENNLGIRMLTNLSPIALGLAMVARDIMTPNPSVVKQDASVDEIISIMVQKEIELVPVIEDDNSKKLVGVVARLDILREKLNEGFLTIGKREALSRT